MGYESNLRVKYKYINLYILKILYILVGLQEILLWLINASLQNFNLVYSDLSRWYTWEGSSS